MSVNVTYRPDIRTIWRDLEIDGEHVASFATDRELVDYLANGQEEPQPLTASMDADDRWEPDYDDVYDGGGYEIDVPRYTDYVN